MNALLRVVLLSLFSCLEATDSSTGVGLGLKQKVCWKYKDRRRNTPEVVIYPTKA